MDHPERPTETYDITAVSHEREHVPLVAGTTIYAANDIARARSGDDQWSAVLVKIARTGQITDTYVNGKRQP
jgi:hypothetical protein